MPFRCSIGFQPVSGSTTQSLGAMHRDPNRIVSSEAAPGKSNTGWKPVLHWAGALMELPQYVEVFPEARSISCILIL